MNIEVVPIKGNFLYKIGFQDGWRAKTEELKKNFINRQNENKEIIIEAIEKYFDMPMEKLIKRGRKRNVVLARQLVSFFLCRYTNLKLMGIAKLLKQDHTTIIHSRETIKDLLFTENEEAVLAVESIENEVYSKLNPEKPVTV